MCVGGCDMAEESDVVRNGKLRTWEGSRAAQRNGYITTRTSVTLAHLRSLFLVRLFAGSPELLTDLSSLQLSVLNRAVTYRTRPLQ